MIGFLEAGCEGRTLESCDQTRSMRRSITGYVVAPQCLMLSRTTVPIGEGHALVDEIIWPRVLHLVTIEFDTEETAKGFHPIEWFESEVTADPRYTHHSIALRGLDEVPEIPLSDAALNSLIDTLESRFPAQARMAISRPKAKQVPLARAKAQISVSNSLTGYKPPFLRPSQTEIALSC